MKHLIATFIFACIITSSFCQKQYNFRNASLPLEARVGDLLKQLTLEEKISWQQ